MQNWGDEKREMIGGSDFTYVEDRRMYFDINWYIHTFVKSTSH